MNHNIKHEYYVGGYGGHDWATWRHLLYHRFLPNLWRKQLTPERICFSHEVLSKL